MKNFWLLIAVAASSLVASAVNPREEIALTPEKAGGIYFAYPFGETTEGIAEAIVPEGYKPFYISHYGRHGSRYLISDSEYKDLLDLFVRADSAAALTPAGREALESLRKIWAEAEGRGGELTPLGERQHRAIARRAASAYPEVFADSAEVGAASTPVMRCAHSMFAFIEGLKELNPHLQVSRESAERNMWYLNYHSPESGKYSSSKAPWHGDYIAFRDKVTRPERLVGALFSNEAYLSAEEADELMWKLYWLAVDVQNMETREDFLQYFTNEELYDLWQAANFNFYATNSSYPPANGEFVKNARNLVGHIVVNADNYILNGKHGATLRFGHDGNIVPLTALMEIEDCYSDAVQPEELAPSGYALFNVSPMAANLQLIFFRPDGPEGEAWSADDVLVRVLLNEKDVHLPIDVKLSKFYSWADLRPFLVERANIEPVK